MNLSKFYIVFAACFEQVHCLLHSTRVRPRSSSDGDRKGPKRARCRSNSSLPCEAVHKTCFCSIAAAARVRSTLQKSAEQRSQKVPSYAAALINLKNAACLILAAKRLSVVKSPANRLSYVKAHAKCVERLTMRACNCSTCSLDVILISEDMRLLGCFNCLFEYYCNDKDKCCDLSVF